MNIDTIKILFTGDFCPHNRIETLALKSDYKSVFNDFIQVFMENDLNVTDLECPLTTISAGRIKTGPHQKANPKCIDLLKYAGINLAALANNHIMDYGSEGVKQTIEICRQAGIETMGVNGDEKTTVKPFLTKIKEKSFAFINAADNEFITAPDGPYQANTLNPINIYNSIINIRKSCDFVILFIHGGNEFYHLPSPRIKTLYHFFIDAGADAVISNHTHCFSGYEVYKEKPIFYGLGNFIYDSPGKINSDWNKGYVVQLSFLNQINFRIIPLKQGNEMPGVFLLNDKEKNQFWQEIESLNTIIDSDLKLEQAFQQYTDKITPNYDAYIEPYFGRIYNAIRQRGFLPNLMNRKKRLLLLNLARCEAHREVLIRILKKYE